jgi:hypothetical protein
MFQAAIYYFVSPSFVHVSFTICLSIQVFFSVKQDEYYIVLSTVYKNTNNSSGKKGGGGLNLKHFKFS